MKNEMEKNHIVRMGNTVLHFTETDKIIGNNEGLTLYGTGENITEFILNSSVEIAFNYRHGYYLKKVYRFRNSFTALF